MDDSSEDETELQGKLEALQSKIATIRARTANEDDLVSVKKAKKHTKKATPVVAQQTTRQPLQNPTKSQRSSLSNRPFIEVPYQPPPSSQDFRYAQPNDMRAQPGVRIFSSGSLRASETSQQRGPDLLAGIATGRTAVAGTTTVAIKGEALPCVGQGPAFTMPPPIAQTPQDVVDLTSSPPLQGAQVFPGVPAVEPVLCAEQQHVVDLIMVSHLRPSV